MIELEKSDEAYNLSQYKCPVCSQAHLTFLYPPGRGEDILYRHDFDIGGVPVFRLFYTYDGLQHFIYVVAETVVAARIGTFRDNVMQSDFCLPGQLRITDDLYTLEWRDGILFVNNTLVEDPIAAYIEAHADIPATETLDDPLEDDYPTEDLADGPEDAPD